MSWWSLIPMMFSGGGQKPLAMGGGPRGLPMGTPLSVSGQPIQVGPPNGQLVQGAVATPPTGAAPLVPPPGGMASYPTSMPSGPGGQMSYGVPTAGGIPAALGTTQPVSYSPQPGEAPNGPGITNAMYGIENAGSIAANQAVGVQPGTGPSAIDAAGTPTPTPLTPTPEEDGKDDLWWMSLIDRGGPSPMAPGSGPRGMQQNNVKQMHINPQTGLIEWV